MSDPVPPVADVYHFKVQPKLAVTADKIDGEAALLHSLIAVTTGARGKGFFVIKTLFDIESQP